MAIKVDFYILPEKTLDESIRFTCRLTEKIFHKGYKVFIKTESQQQAEQVSKTLWTFRDVSFVPHNIFEENPLTPAPIQVGYLENPKEHHEVLINLTTEIPEYYNRFERVLEVIPTTQKQAGRKKYKSYKQQNCELTTHKI